ncbi:MAG: hypothetical protein Q4G61_09910 [Tissierellia bacterium]|nr:hypothetical protein [Tissierellia bacterium]
MNKPSDEKSYSNYDEETGQRLYDLIQVEQDRAVQGLELGNSCMKCGHVGVSAYCEECGARKAYFKIEEKGKNENGGNLMDKMMGFFGITKN